MKFLISISSTIFVFVLCCYLWEYIKLPFHNPEEIISYLSNNNINPLNDTVRFIFLFSLTVGTYFFVRLFQEKKFVKISFFFQNKYYQKLSSFDFNEIKLIIFFLFLYIFVDFFSFDPNYFFYDPLHDGDNLTPSLNFDLTKKIWSSSFAIHGASNSLYGFLGWKLFDTQSIGALRYFYILLLLLVKILTIFLSYQIIKIINLNNNQKKYLFFFLSIILINFVDYQVPINYSIISFRDLYLIVYLIFLIQLFSDSIIKKKFLVILSFISNLALIFHYDTGTYLQIINLVLILYFIFSNDFKSITYLIISYIVFWSFLLVLLGPEEIRLFIEHYFIIIGNIDFIHGSPFPTPIIDLGSNEHAARATRAIVLLIFSSCLIIENVFFSEKFKFQLNQKILLLLFLFISILTFKNALGRSDSYHIRMSTELPIIIVFIFFMMLFYTKDYFKFLGNISQRLILIFFISLLIFQEFDAKKFFEYKRNFNLFVYSNDSKYLDKEALTFINNASLIFKDQNCIFNFTMDLGLPYLLKKKTCSRYLQTYTMSGVKNEKKYISELKRVGHKFIIYESPKFDVDNIKITDRLKNVDNFILTNYDSFYNKDGYKILKKR